VFEAPIELEPGALFRDRAHAGRVLARALCDERHEDAVVVGLARGGVPVAAEVARELDLPLDLVVVRKVGHPWQPEYAIGAVTSSGGLYMRGRDGLTEEQVAVAVAAAQREARQLEEALRRTRRARASAGRRVLLVDDGLATGATMVAAVRWARDLRAARVVAAAPVGSAHAATLLRHEADRVVCPHAFTYFAAVGSWYDDFTPVDDDEVLRLLAAAEGASRPPAGNGLPAR
jgi:putative phosphoribosyl transferase